MVIAMLAVIFACIAGLSVPAYRVVSGLFAAAAVSGFSWVVSMISLIAKFRALSQPIFFSRTWVFSGSARLLMAACVM